MRNDFQQKEKMLAELLRAAGLIADDNVLHKALDNVLVRDIQLDSRAVTSGALFIALKGQQVNGEDYISQALASGAAAVLKESVDANSVAEWIDGRPVVSVSLLAKRVSYLAAAFFDADDWEYDATGITGTNGKTSVAVLVAQVMAALGRKAGLLGTLGVAVADLAAPSEIHFTETGFTTPDAIATQRFLDQLRGQGCDCVVMEVSSHALAQHRVAAVPYRTAVITNITRDHLDFHGSMDAYIAAKAALFQFASLRAAVINIDDANAAKMVDQVSSTVEVITYSLRQPTATVWASKINYCEDGTELLVHHSQAHAHTHAALRLPLIGAFNVSNALAVISVLLAKGFDLASIVRALASVKGVSGRMEAITIDGPADIRVIVDFAHTPDALKAALEALKLHSASDLVCVFGCGGNRDVGKRPEMGAIAVAGASRVYITSDNPRNEQPEDIANDILQGISRPQNVVVELDRAVAIRRAIHEAKAGDWVLIAGKGHEQAQEIAGKKYPFDDREVVRKAMQERFAA